MGHDQNVAVLDWPLDASEHGREVWYLLVTARDENVAVWYHLELVAGETPFVHPSPPFRS